MSKPDGGPLFPDSVAQGATLRDYFASEALGGLLAGAANGIFAADRAGMAEAAYSYADAMIAERDK